MKINEKIVDIKKSLKERGFKLTRQREIILEEFMKSNRHFNTEEFYEKVRKKMHGIGYATVYRTLKILRDCGVAMEMDFGDGAKRFETVPLNSTHHDHIYCISCGRIDEFTDPKIEQLQERIAKKFKYKIVNHTMQLFGYCRSCSGKVKDNA